MNKIEENALRGGDIVKTLLKFSRPAGEYKVATIEQIVSTALEVVGYRVNLNLIDVVREIPENLPSIKGDLNQLADSLFNLMSNAFDATQKKAELITEQKLTPEPNDPVPYKGQIHLRARMEYDGEKKWVILEVQDNGVGMSQTEVEQLFIPFFTTKATAEKGTGLGLYVIQRILEQHGGTVQAASAYGVGTTFTFKMPVHTEPGQ